MKGAATAAGLEPGTRLGRYTLVRRVARGGMAELYIAQQRGAAGFEKIVALKRILPHLAEDPTFTQMFLAEARLASNLDHPNLAHVLDFGEHEGEHFLTMEYVHGRNLLQLLNAMESSTLPLAAALTIVTEVARGLHDLHEHRAPDGRPLALVHRDVSPSNVMVSYEGTVKLTDFGIAKSMALTSATKTGTFKGKLGHSSPEQARGETIDRRSDVFCLGILLYEATTAARAFSGVNEFAVLGKVARGDYVPPTEVVPGYPAPLAEIVTTALRTDPATRYPTAAAMADAIDDFARRAGIRSSSEAVADAMLATFGPAPPVVDQDELTLVQSAPTIPGSPVVALEPRAARGSVPLVLAVSLALLTGATGMWLWGPSSRAPADDSAEVVTPTPEATESAPSVTAARPPPADATPPSDASASASVQAPTDEADAVAPVVEADSAEDSPGVEPEPRGHRKTSRRRPRRKKKSTPSSTRTLEGLYPPEG